MCYPVCGIVHIKNPMLNGKSSYVVTAAGFLSLSELSLTMYPTPITVVYEFMFIIIILKHYWCKSSV